MPITAFGKKVKINEHTVCKLLKKETFISTIALIIQVVLKILLKIL